MGKILVTGSSGYLGSFFSNRFYNRNHKVYGIDIVGGEPQHFEKFFQGSVLDEVFMKRVSKFFSDHDTKIDAIVNSFYHPENQYVSTKEKFGHLDRKELLQDAFLGYSASEFAKELELNVAGLHNVNRYVMPHADGGKLKVVNIGSVLSIRQPNPVDLEFEDRFRYKPPGYSVSKSAVLSYTEYCANLFSDTGFRFNAVVPGFIHISDTPQAEEFENRVTRRMSVRRFANPEDIFCAVEYLVSNHSDYINGQQLIIDGGYSIS